MSLSTSLRIEKWLFRQNKQTLSKKKIPKGQKLKRVFPHPLIIQLEKDFRSQSSVPSLPTSSLDVSALPPVFELCGRHDGADRAADADQHDRPLAASFALYCDADASPTCCGGAHLRAEPRLLARRWRGGEQKKGPAVHHGQGRERRRWQVGG